MYSESCFNKHGSSLVLEDLAEEGGKGCAEREGREGNRRAKDLIEKADLHKVSDRQNPSPLEETSISKSCEYYDRKREPRHKRGYEQHRSKDRNNKEMDKSMTNTSFSVSKSNDENLPPSNSNKETPSCWHRGERPPPRNTSRSYGGYNKHAYHGGRRRSRASEAFRGEEDIVERDEKGVMEETVDSEEEYRRSRSRERKRRRTQYETMQRNRRGANEEFQVFWDGFQWVKKGDGNHEYDQEMNSTRRARRLHIGNLPLSAPDVSEDDFRAHLSAALASRGFPFNRPVLHVWFARDRGGSFGFVEMASVEAAHAALLLDGLAWKGSTLRINRPTDWKSSTAERTIQELASASGLSLAVAESLAAAAQQARATGNTGGLIKLVSSLPEGGQKIITELLNSQAAACQPVDRAVDLIKEKIKAELLVGAPSRVVRIERPSLNAKSEEELSDVLEDIKQECAKGGTIVAAFMATSRTQEHHPPTVAIGDALVEYASVAQADKCILDYSGRIFDGSPLKICRFDETSFKTHLRPLSQNLFLKNFDAKNAQREVGASTRDA